jgi:hypothetical protein
MRKSPLLLFALLLAALPLAADDERHQSYFTYEDGGTVIRQGDDGHTADATVNFPVFPGDEIATSRRGRAEIRLSDGNIVALDRSTTLFFVSILDSYDGDNEGTIAELRQGQVIIHRLEDDSSPLRLDTANASYISSRDAIYGVDSDSRGRDVVSVYDGSIEVRTPSRTVTLSDGEQATLDEGGVYDVVRLARDGISDFERWYLRRSERYGRGDSEHLTSRLSYADSYLRDHGSWVYVGDYGSYVWRPYVAAGWRPYYYGRWVVSPYGGMVWVSDEPWGFVPYHYGRWAYSGRYGWVWVPGYGYSHAWVYWAYGPSYVGWVPAGWFDCYTPYIGWAYRPYRRHSYDFGFGFYGHIRLRNTDLSPWTFVDPQGLGSGRVDGAVLTTDAIRQRLQRDGDQATVTRGVRLTRNEIRDPASAVRRIARRGGGGGTGTEGSGTTADMTPFFRRDPEVSSALRDRIARPNRGAGDTETGRTSGEGVAGRINRGGGNSSPSTPGEGRGVIRRQPTNDRTPGDSGRTVRRDRGESNRPSTGDSSPRGGGRTITRERPETPRARPETNRERDETPRVRPETNRESAPAPRVRPETNRESGRSEWRSRPSGRTPETRTTAPEPRAVPESRVAPRGEQNWRGTTRTRNEDRGGDSTSARESRPRSVPRTVIEGIGGPRVTPKRDDSPSRSVGRSRESSRPSTERSARPEPRTSTDRPSTRSSGSSDRPSTRSSGSSERSSGRSSGSDNSDRGKGRVKRD